MRSLPAALSLTALVLAAASAARADSDVTSLAALEALIAGKGDATIVPGRALVKLVGIDDANLLFVTKQDSPEARALAELGKRTGLSLTFVRASLFGWAVVDVRDAADLKTMPTVELTRAFIARLADDRAIDLVAEEAWHRPLRTPNDPTLAQMWHLDQIGAKSAWDRTVGTSSQRIGVIDTGLVRAHPEFQGRVAAGFDFIASANAGNDGNGRDADFNDAGDACGGGGNSFHGTHVAGTMGAATDNGAGVAGLNWNAGLVIARSLGRCGGSTVDIMEAAAWMAGARINGVPDVGPNKVSVMNLSLGVANRCSAYEQQMVDFVTNQGVLMVVAAGNDGGAVGSPASCRGAIAVSAVGPTNQRTRYSSFGAETAIMAPGGDTSIRGGGVISTIGANGLAAQQGTSMASPHVAGAISLVQALSPGISRNAVVDLLRRTGAQCGNCGGVPALRIGAALASIAGQTPEPPPAAPPQTPPPTSNDDRWEENDTPQTATAARCGTDEARLVAGAADQDWFSFQPPQGQPIRIDLVGSTGADLDLYIVDDSGRNILARSETNTGTERIAGNASGRPLRLLVNPYTDSARGVAHSGGYRLTIRCGSGAQAATSTENDDVFFDGALDGIVDDTIVVDDADGGLDEPTEPVAPDLDANAGDVLDGDVSASGGCAAGGAAGFPIVLALVAIRRRRRLVA